MSVRKLRFLKLPNRGTPNPEMPSTSRNKNEVSKEKTDEGHMMEIMDINDVPEPSNFVEVMDTDNNNDTQNPTTDQVAGASATAAVGPMELNTECLVRNSNGDADDVEFTEHEVEMLWHETLSALSGMLNDGEVHSCYREMLQVERCCIENNTNTNTNHTCYERWRDGNIKENNSK